ncbi:winged helix-turn-helix transcriptional regulator [Streptomyces sp. PU-14G]|uniref:winged helix-turn-helix transcriptional regulator n=1 Tax=Streptomyces sp. PU-14G TaxID=2800808 RepID=UPI0034DFC425
MPARITDCPLAKAAQFIGDWPTLELLHEMFDGYVHIEELRANLRVEPDVLTARLAGLVARGVVELETGSQDRYVPTPLGRSLRPVLLVLAAWGNRELDPEERGMILVDSHTGQEVEPVLVDRVSGARVDTDRHVFMPGPVASDAMLTRFGQQRGRLGDGA